MKALFWWLWLPLRLCVTFWIGLVAGVFLWVAVAAERRAWKEIVMDSLSLAWRWLRRRKA